MSEDGVLVRRDWMFEVRSACQRFQCLTLNADRTQLEERLRRLAHEVPAPGTIQEAEALTDRLKICSTDAGMALHLAYHEASAYQTCTASPVELAMHVWRQYHADPRVTYLLWIDTFFAAFDSTHPAPSCERAAAILRHRYANVPSLRAVAKEVGASTSQLNRDFRKRYKMSCGEYSSRARLRWFIGEIRKPDSTATRLAMEAGYRSYHNLLSALRKRVGLTPIQIRSLSDKEIRDLLDGPLALDVLSRPLTVSRRLARECMGHVTRAAGPQRPLTDTLVKNNDGVVTAVRLANVGGNRALTSA